MPHSIAQILFSGMGVNVHSLSHARGSASTRSSDDIAPNLTPPWVAQSSASRSRASGIPTMDAVRGPPSGRGAFFASSASGDEDGISFSRFQVSSVSASSFVQQLHQNRVLQRYQLDFSRSLSSPAAATTSHSSTSLPSAHVTHLARSFAVNGHGSAEMPLEIGDSDDDSGEPVEIVFSTSMSRSI